MKERLDDKLTSDDLEKQFEICGYYLLFAFRKMGAPTKRLRNNFKNFKMIRVANVKDWK